MKEPRLYRNPDRYRRAVRELARVLEKTTPSGVSVGLADYADEGLSPLRSSDLLTAAEHPERNIYYPYFSARLRLLFGETKPSVAGISLNYLSQALCAFSMAGFIRREFPGLRVIMGGGLVTSWTKMPGRMRPFTGLVDHFVTGPGEFQLLSLLGIDAGSESMPCPEYATLPLDQYLSPGVVVPYSASTGCYWNRCGFCPEKAEENPYVPIPVPQTMADLAGLADRMRPSLIHILDNAVSPAHLNALSGESTGVPWYGFARVNSQLADPGFCRQLKEAGCVMLKLGIESGDQEVLDRLEKGIDLETASAVLKNLKEAGIAAYVYLLFGTPAETITAARKTLEFTVRHSSCIDFLNLAIFNMPVCSKSADTPNRRGFYEADLSLYTDFVHPQGWDRKKVRLFLDREFRRHPAVAAILKKEPPAFTSNHAPFFIMNRS